MTATSTNIIMTPAMLASIVLTRDEHRDVELRHVLEHAKLNHEQTWRSSHGISQGTGYFLMVLCSCKLEFCISRIN